MPNASKKSYYNKHKQLGLCVSCNKQADNRTILCKEHKRKRYLQHRKRKDKLFKVKKQIEVKENVANS